MMDYDKQDEDPIVAEVRRAREELAARFNYDLRAIMEHFQRGEPTTGHEYVSPPPRRPEPSPAAPNGKVG